MNMDVAESPKAHSINNWERCWLPHMFPYEWLDVNGMVDVGSPSPVLQKQS
jgi:hypothetical protein